MVRKAKVNANVRKLLSWAKTKGKPPGSLIYVGDKEAQPIEIQLTSYNRDSLSQREVEGLAECVPESKDKSTVTWIEVQGLADSKRISEIGREFGIESLWLEDVLNTEHRPKVEELEDLMFVILKNITVRDDKTFEFDQISILMGDGFVISFEEQKGDAFAPVKDRIKQNIGWIRKKPSDYLFYALVDCVVDNYFVGLESAIALSQQYESELERDQENFNFRKLLRLKTELSHFKRAVVPAKDLIMRLVQTDLKGVRGDTHKFFSDVADHIVHLIEMIEDTKEHVSDLMEEFQITVNQRLNEIMKVLTIFASLFIPLTFIAGIYGMNFEYMPELKAENGYFYALGGMAGLAIFMLLYFRRKRWL